MKFKNIDLAKNELIESIILKDKANKEGNDKIQAKNMQKVLKITAYIKENFDIREMRDMLDHKNAGVQVWAAKILLPIYEDIALEILDNISKAEIPFSSSSARIIFCEWTKQPITFIKK